MENYARRLSGKGTSDFFARSGWKATTVIDRQNEQLAQEPGRCHFEAELFKVEFSVRQCANAIQACSTKL